MLKPIDQPKLKGKPRLKVWAIALLSAPLLTFAQPPVDIPFIGLIALVPLFIALPRLSAGGAWLAGWLVGMCYFWFNMWWLGQMVTDPGNEWIIFAMFAFVSTAMAIYYGVATMTIRWLMTRRQQWTIWLVPLAWLGFEFAHEFNTPAPYPWLEIGLSVMEFTPFIQTADIWGQYGLTAGLVLVSMGLAAPFAFDGEAANLTIRKERLHRWVLPGVAIGFVVLSCLYGFIRISQIEDRERDDGPLVACVQGNLSMEVKVKKDPLRLPNAFTTHLEMTREAVDNDAELVCWAETMLFYGSTREGYTRTSPKASAKFFTDGVPDEQLMNAIAYDAQGKRHTVTYVEHLRARVAHDFETPMLVGSLTDVPKEEQIYDWKEYAYRRYNTAMMFDAQGRVAGTYDKRYLVPGGEYIPLEGLEFFGWAPVRDIVAGYSEGLQGYVSRVEPGLRTTLFRLPSKAERLEGRDWAYTATICYEYSWPGCYVELHESQQTYPDFHVNISNEGWFKESAELDQAVDYCQMRCIESRVPMIRATNTGVTCNIDACGRVRETLIVDGRDREVAGLFMARPYVLEGQTPTIFVSIVKRGLAWLALIVILCVMPVMAAGRMADFRKRRRAKRAANTETAAEKEDATS